MGKGLTPATGKPIFGKGSKIKGKQVQAPLSDERVQEDSSSEEDQSDEAERIKKLRPSQIETESESEGEESSRENGRAASSSTDSSGSSEDGADSSGETSGNRSDVSQPALSNGKRKSPSDTEMDSGSESERTQTPSKRPRTSAPTPIRIAQPPSAIPAHAYIPPEGYRPLATGSTSAGFDRSGLVGKRVWHITAPQNVPLAGLTTLSPQAFRDGAVVLQHDGIQYVLKEDESLARPAVLLSNGSGFSKTEQDVEVSFRLCAKLDVPASAKSRFDAGSAKAADVATAAVVAIRPQPKGLRMRYKPPGSKSTTLDLIGTSSDDDSGDAPQQTSQFQFPRTMGGHPGMPNGDHSSTSTPKKKSKKHKHAEETPVNGLAKHTTPSKRSKLSQDTSQEPGALNDERTRRKAEKTEKKRKKLVSLPLELESSQL